MQRPDGFTLKLNKHPPEDNLSFQNTKEKLCKEKKKPQATFFN